MEQPPRPPTANSTPEAPSERQPLDWRTLHLWQIQPVRDVLVLLPPFGLLWLGYLLSVVTVPILIALALAYLLEPVVARLARISWLNRPAAALILILSLTIAVFVPLTVAVSFGVVQGFQAVERVAHNL